MNRIIQISSLIFSLCGNSLNEEIVHRSNEKLIEAHSVDLPVPKDVRIFSNGYYTPPDVKVLRNAVAHKRQYIEVYWSCPEWNGLGKEFEISCYISDDRSGTNKTLIEKLWAPDHGVQIASIEITDHMINHQKKSGKNTSYISVSVRSVSLGIEGAQTSEWKSSEYLDMGADCLFKPPPLQLMSFLDSKGRFIDATVDMLRQEVFHVLHVGDAPSLIDFDPSGSGLYDSQLFAVLYRMLSDKPEHMIFEWSDKQELESQLKYIQNIQMKHKVEKNLITKQQDSIVQMSIKKTSSVKPHMISETSSKNMMHFKDIKEYQGFTMDWITGKVYVAYAGQNFSSSVAIWSFMDFEIFNTGSGNTIEHMLINPYRNELYLLLANQDHTMHKIERWSLDFLDSGFDMDSSGKPHSENFFSKDTGCNCSSAITEGTSSIAIDTRNVIFMGGINYEEAAENIGFLFGTASGNVFTSDILGCMCKKVASVPLEKPGPVTVVSIDNEGVYFSEEKGPLWAKNHKNEEPQVVLDLLYTPKKENVQIIQVFESKTFGTARKPFPKRGDCMVLSNPPKYLPKFTKISHNDFIFDISMELPPEKQHCNQVARPGFFIVVKYRKLTDESKGKWDVFETAVTKEISVSGLNSSTLYEVQMLAKNFYGITEPAKPFFVRTTMDPDIYRALVIGGIIVTCIIIMAMILGFIAFVRYFRKTMRAQRITDTLAQSSFKVFKIVEAKDITVVPNEILGVGEFGQVIKGIIHEEEKAEQRKVALKSLEYNRSDSNKKRDVELDFFAEADALSRLQETGTHANIVELLGVCIDSQTPYLVMELMETSVKTFISEIGKGQTRTLLHEEDTIRIALDVACGMVHLHDNHYIHRDLRASNVFLTTRNPLNFVAKIGDFGMAQDISKLKTKGYQIPKEGVMPLCWMSPETLSNRDYTFESDVWSFGVFCWEMAAFGDTPYREFHNEGSFENQVKEWVVNQCGNPGDPQRLPRFYQQIMKPCWAYDPKKRFSFSQLASKLTSLVVEMERSTRRLSSIDEPSSRSSGYSSGGYSTGSSSDPYSNGKFYVAVPSMSKEINPPDSYMIGAIMARNRNFSSPADDTAQHGIIYKSIDKVTHNFEIPLTSS